MRRLVLSFVIVAILIPLGLSRSATSAVLGQTTATLRGQITDEDTGIPLLNVTVTLGERITYTDNGGNFEFTDITPLGSYLFAATVSNYEDYGERITISEGDNLKNLSLRSTGTYSGEAGIEYEVSIINPETGYAHVTGIFKHILSETVTMRMHYVDNRWISIENIVVTNENEDPLPFELSVTHDFFYWYNLEIEAGTSSRIILEYDIHYVSICHNGDSNCIHGYICDSYAVFETIGHILFLGSADYLLTDGIAVRFILPPGWIRVAPLDRHGNYFVNSEVGEIEYASPGVGRFELHRESVGDSEFAIGIHENANDFAPDPINWPVNIQNVLRMVEAADSLLHYEQRKSVVVGIPPLGPNETGLDSMYMPATNFPYGLAAAVSLVEDVHWFEGKWLLRGTSSYFGELILYKSGVWSRDTYKTNLDSRKNLYLNEVYNTVYDLPIPDLEGQSDPAYGNAKDAKFHLFLYILDYEVRKVTQEEKTLTDVMVYWRHHLPPQNFTDAELLGALNTCTGNDFTDFFNKYYFGTEKFPVEIEWDPLMSQQLYLPIILKYH